jgi:hypothetical protein
MKRESNEFSRREFIFVPFRGPDFEIECFGSSFCPWRAEFQLQWHLSTFLS